MARRLTVKRLRQLAALGFSGVLIVCFQNCSHESNDMCIRGTNCPEDLASTDPTTDSNSPSFGGSNRGPSADSSGPSFGGGSGGGAPTVGGFTNGMKITKDLPSTLRVVEGNNIALDIYVEGGSGSYKYAWYRNNKKVEVPGGDIVNFYGDVADRYYKETSYFVIISDSAGGQLKSKTTVVSFAEATNGCSGGNYAIGDGTDRTGMIDVSSLFITPRGFFFVHGSHPSIAHLMNYPGYWGFHTYNWSAGPYMAVRGIPCTTYLPSKTSLKTGAASAASVDEGGIATAASWHWEGQITIECHNNKWKVINNTCHQVEDPPTD